MIEFVQTIHENVDRKDLMFLVYVSYVSIDVASNLSTMTAIRTLESWYLTALIIQVSTQTTFMDERICTVWTLKAFPHCTRTIFPFDLLLLDMNPRSNLFNSREFSFAGTC
ncbi:hypothetical protein V1478_015909 [Vespula squamosa]|uniref:Uncharacterized protein n=1 Tax=Vespula squamosa TaxID=30214 RepID=A0ABD2A276_VESSQ